MRLHLEQPKNPRICTKIHLGSMKVGSFSKSDPLIDGIPLPSRATIENMERKEQERRDQGRTGVPLHLPEREEDDSDESGGSNSGWRPPVENPTERGVTTFAFI